MEDVGAAVVAGCNGPPVLLSGKEIPDFVTLALQPLAVMDWFLAAATGRDARRDALLGQHLTDCVPVLPLIPHHRGRRRQVFVQHISTGEVTALPLTQVGVAGDHLRCGRPHGACWSCPPLGPPIRRGAPPLLRLDAVGWALMSVASIISTSGSGASGSSAESDADNSEKISSNTPLSHQRRQRLSRFLWAGASTQRRPFCMTGMMPLNTLRSSTRFPPPSLGKRGGCQQPAPR